MNDFILFKDINDKYQTLPELLVPVEEDTDSTETAENTDNAENTENAQNADD